MDENQRFMFESQKWIIKNKKPLNIFLIYNFFLNLSVLLIMKA